jgi:hypothetical protein
MMPQYFLIKIICSYLVGFFLIAAAIFEWRFFFNDLRIRFVVRLIGRPFARILYLLIGIFFVLIAYEMSPPPG